MGVILASIFLGGCDSSPGERKIEGMPSTLERLRKEGIVHLGYANEAPYAFYDNQKERLTGEAPEIARVVLEHMGIEKIEGVLTEFGSLIPGLNARRFNIIAAGMYITPKRCREITFSNPTYGIGEAFMVKTGNPLKLHSYKDVASNPLARLGVVAGAIELKYALSTNVPHERIFVLPDAPSAVAGIRAGRVDAYAGTSLTIQDLLQKAGDSNLERAMPFKDPVMDGKSVTGFGAFGFHKEDTELVNAFNEQLQAFIGSEEHLKLVEAFGFTKENLPGDQTAEDLCKP